MQPVKGALPIALRAKAEDKIGLLVPKDNAARLRSSKVCKSFPFKICAKRWVFSKAK